MKFKIPPRELDAMTGAHGKLTCGPSTPLDWSPTCHIIEEINSGIAYWPRQRGTRTDPDVYGRRFYRTVRDFVFESFCETFLRVVGAAGPSAQSAGPHTRASVARKPTTRRDSHILAFTTKSTSASGRVRGGGERKRTIKSYSGTAHPNSTILQN